MAPNIQTQTVRDGNGTIKSDAILFRPSTPQTTPILATKGGEFDVSQSFTSIVQIALNVLINPDEAYRADRQQQEQMLHDPVVMGPLQKRLLATAKLEWEIVAEDLEDQEQVRICDAIMEIIGRMPRFQEFIRYLGFAVFRGTSASEINWSFDDLNRVWGITNHRPYHGDKITFDIYGRPRILTRQFQTGGRELDSSEKDRIIIHIHDRDDGEFYAGAQAGYVFKGRGLRDVIWPYWFLKHNAVRLWTVLLDKHAMGWIEGRYPQGNAAAKAAIESVLQNLLSGTIVSVPVPAGVDKETFGIFPIKMPDVVGAAKLFSDFCEEYCGKHIRILIEGQQQAQQESGDGLGSGRSQELADIFTMYRDYDAGLIQDTLTETLVQRVQWFNFGQLPFKCKFQFVLDGKNYEDQAKRVDAAQKAGLTVLKKWVFESLDAPMPDGSESEEELIHFGAAPLPGQPQAGRLFATDAAESGGRLFASDAAPSQLFQTSLESHQPENYRQLFGGIMDQPLFNGAEK